ncbi:hypothetical protein A5773_04190 [Mycobacterium sp. 852014-52450_SCH5900713]|uniref:hypothetical protein n=1 Tax=Mycobacterium sp. 852014-52450_SCH5900713 TaxID=1834116 RepID=UPI0007FD4724|nr:hypothetical protein [Mycobacterium sp. 852014-52450_SCH5900713]OBG00694.1 hypothetical protein A5773_04190 [Mycobacterium sp. 852014-52450_SCH5900713]
MTKAKKRRLTLADLTAAERERAALAFHEAGHAIAATLLGGRIRAAVISEGRAFGMLGKAVHDQVPGGGWPSILYAGPWAEARFRAGRRPTQRELFTALEHNGCDDRELSRAGGSVTGAGVVPLLERCWPSVAKLAAQLWSNSDVRHGDVCAALQIPERDNGFHLSLIRSGTAPGNLKVTRSTAATASTG